MNQVMNLTAITEEKEVVVKHFLDSISLVKYYSFQEGDTVIDVGTGAGFPGIPLAILLPKVSFTLMDSLNKRISFLEHVKDICELDNVKCIHSRAEELGRDELHREKYDVCVSRAVANLSVLLEYCIPFVKKGGTFVSYKSLSADDEIQQSKNAQNKLCCKLSKNISFCLGSEDYSRNFLMFEKFDFLSKKYPRQNGIPKKKPL
jgi:16S rRNA (guanine527-N7)-methyltransferase